MKQLYVILEVFVQKQKAYTPWNILKVFNHHPHVCCTLTPHKYYPIFIHNYHLLVIFTHLCKNFHKAFQIPFPNREEHCIILLHSKLFLQYQSYNKSSSSLYGTKQGSTLPATSPVFCSNQPKSQDTQFDQNKFLQPSHDSLHPLRLPQHQLSLQESPGCHQIAVASVEINIMKVFSSLKQLIKRFIPYVILTTILLNDTRHIYFL